MTVDECEAAGVCPLCEGCGKMAAVSWSEAVVLPCNLCDGTGKYNRAAVEAEEASCRAKLYAH